jgi:beta-fructofuranosidase
VFKAGKLDRWSHVGDLLHHTVPGVALREDISCPDLFTLGGKQVLVCISHRLGARYYVGEWKNEQFHPEVHERMSWADNLYFAPESLEDPNGRRIMWAWIFDQRSGPTRKASGWSGEMALPRELRLGPDNRLRMRPIEELKRLRYDERVFGPIDVVPDRERAMDGLSGDTMEIQAEIEPKGAKRVGLNVRRSPDGEEKTTVFIDLSERKLGINQEAGPFSLSGKSVTLRVFLDRSIIEAFADDRQAVVRRCYPSRADAVGVSVFAIGGAARIRRLTAWKIFPSSPY